MQVSESLDTLYKQNIANFCGILLDALWVDELAKV